MKKNTREALLGEAEILFSDNGFDGTSINQIASRLGITKQALLHHFATKEKLYAAVLERAANHLQNFFQASCATNTSANHQLIHFFTAISNAEGQSYRVVVLLMRELMDNSSRAETAKKWYLRSFLDELVSVGEKAQIGKLLNGTSALTLVYHLLGATQYFLVSRPTLQRLYTAQEFAEHLKQHQALIKTLLAN